MLSNDVVAPHVVLLGEALQPVLRRIETELRKPVRPVGGNVHFAATGKQAADQLADALQRLSDEGNGALNDIVRSEDAPEAQVHYAVGRFARVLDDMLQHYAELRQVRPWAWHRREHEVLVATFHHFLTQIQSWLRDVVEATEDPIKILRRKGLPTDGSAVLVVKLHLTNSNEMDDWLAEEDRNPGFWYGAAALVAGIFVGGMLFGGDDD